MKQEQLKFRAKQLRKKRVKVSPKRKDLIRLSPTSGLNLFKECPRCFWLHHNERLSRPQGPFPSLPGGMDLVIKRYFDRYRDSLPPELQGEIPGKLLADIKLLNAWRNWRTGLSYRRPDLHAELFGALDDCLVIGDRYVPLDYKTRGSPPKPGMSEEYYQLQLDAYALLLQVNGYPVHDVAYLVYFYPLEFDDHHRVKFAMTPVAVPVNPERGQRIFEEAVTTLRGALPKRHTRCEFCYWNSLLEEFD